MEFPLAFLLAGNAELPYTIFLVFGAAKICGELSERIGVSGVVGQILAGILLGPAVLALVQPTEFLSALAELGVMFLLFQVGLEVKASELIQVGSTATLTAVLGVILPLFTGWGLAALWGTPHIEGIFLGAAMVATSVGITAKVLSEKGLMSERSAKIILAAAIIDDVLGLLVLAVVSSMAKGSVNYAQLAATSVLAIGFVALVGTWGGRAVKKIVDNSESLRVAEGQFAFALILLFGLAALSIYIGVAAIIGAFLAGMAFAETVSRRVHDLAFGVSEFLVPFFLAGIGLHMRFEIFGKTSSVLFVILVLFGAVLSKIVGCGLGASSLGRQDALRIGVGMVPRGEVGMVVAQIGFGLGVVGNEIYAVVIAMSVLTTMVAPPMLKWAYRGVAASKP